jgi:FAD/FMN-containing dehydrogenase
MTSSTTRVRLSPADAARELKQRCGALVHLPDDPSYDGVRMPWNVAVDQRPAAVAMPTSPEEVAQLVGHAAELGLRVAPQSTGHAAGALAQHRLDDAVLLRTLNLTGVTIDTDRRVARAGTGCLWQDVVGAAAAHGLAALHGSSPDVGVSGFTLGGGIGWYARKLGLATNSVTAVEIVTADGALVRADAERNSDLFWAVRGGGGSFGVVTALEFRLYPIADVFAGMMIWSIEHAEPVLRHWAEWSAQAPDEVTTSFRIMRFPPMPELPDFLRGRELVVIDGAVLGDDAFGAGQVAGLRALTPEMDTFARVPAAALSDLHMDPPGPTPNVGGHTMIGELDQAAVDAFLAAFGPGAAPGLLFAELRQLGGALARPARDGGALACLDGSHAAFFVAIAATPEMAQAGHASVEAAIAAMSPWSNGRSFLNFADGPADAATGYRDEAWARLCAIRAAVDPHDLFVAGHRVPGAAG